VFGVSVSLVECKFNESNVNIRLRIPLGPTGGGEILKPLLELIVAAWLVHYRSNPLPLLYKSGVRYRPEPNRGEYEDFKSPPQTYADGWGDCDDLVIYRCVELRARGELAKVLWLRRRGTNAMHVLVRRANGTTEDPSVILLEKFRVPNG
jgi:hypothetical protein